MLCPLDEPKHQVEGACAASLVLENSEQPSLALGPDVLSSVLALRLTAPDSVPVSLLHALTLPLLFLAT